MNKEMLPIDKPILFVSNHQSAFMDALLIGSIVKEQLHFMSRGESFNTPLKRWIFKQFNMNPIFRKEYSPGQTHRNLDLIKGFQQLLLNKNSILIFPEGISHIEPRLYPIKTGAARVILGAQPLSSHGILLVPIGLNYENPHRFRSKVLVNIGHPIELNEYNKVYAKNERTAIRLLTNRIETELECLTLNVENDALNNFVPVVRSLYEKELIKKSPVELPKEKKAFHIRKDIIMGMHFFEKYFPLRSRRIKSSLRNYQQMLLKYKINDKWLDSEFQQNYQKWPVRNILFYLLGFPVFLYGFINHLCIFKLSPLIAKNINRRPDFKGSLLLSCGVLCFVVFYSLQICLFALMTNSAAWALIYALSLPITAFFVMRYFHKFWKDKDILEFKMALKNNRQKIEYLKKYREQLLHELRLARQAYMASSKKD